MKPLKYATVFLLLALPAQAEPPECKAGYARLAQIAADRAYDRFSVTKPPGRNFVHEARDGTRDFLMWLKGRPYAIVTTEDATPFKANLLARAAAGNKAVIDSSPISIDSIKNEVRELLRLTERYPADFAAFLQDTAAKQAQLEAMERAVEKGLDPARTIKLEVPIPKLDDRGNVLEVTTETFSWNDRVKFDIILRDLRREVHRRLRGPSVWQSKQETYLLSTLGPDGQPILFDAMEHAHRTKKLDVYRAEYHDMLPRLKAHQQPEAFAAAEAEKPAIGLMAGEEPRVAPRPGEEGMPAGAPPEEARAAELVAGKPVVAAPEIDPELHELYDRIDRIYDANGYLNKQYHVPYWAWNRLHWEQFWAELRETFTRIKLKIDDNETLKSIKDFAKSLTPEERKAMHLDRLAETISLGQKNIYVRTLLGVGGSAITGLTGGKFGIDKVLDMWKQYKLEEAERENCAAKKRDTDFRECVQDFLQSKFSVETIKTIVFGKESFLTDTSQIKDPKVRAEVDRLIALRKKHVGTEIQKKENADALDKAIKDVQGEKDPGSDAFREKLIIAPRNGIFIMGLVGDEDNQATAYLSFKHPGQFKRNRELAFQILTETDEDKRKELLTQLRSKDANDLADTLDSLISDREEYLTDPERYLRRGGSRRRKPPVRPRVTDADEKDDKEDKSKQTEATDKDKDKKSNSVDGDAADNQGIVPAKPKEKSPDERDDTN